MLERRLRAVTYFYGTGEQGNETVAELTKQNAEQSYKGDVMFVLFYHLWCRLQSDVESCRVIIEDPDL